MTMPSAAVVQTPPAIVMEGQYPLDEAARILGLKKHTLYARLKRLPGFTPTVIGQRVWVITAQDILRIWELYSNR
jgi:hypothetical protein